MYCYDPLRILNTFSSPFINSINFLRLPSPSGDTTFGSFGWCSPGFCLPNQVAYEYVPLSPTSSLIEVE
jgi:hypothetical protein